MANSDPFNGDEWYYIYQIKEDDEYKLKRCSVKKAGVSADSKVPYLEITEYYGRIFLKPPWKHLIFIQGVKFKTRTMKIFHVPPNKRVRDMLSELEPLENKEDYKLNDYNMKKREN